MLTPTIILIGLIAFIAVGAWVAALLREPARFADAPASIQTLTRAAYWHTRKHWHTVPECVLFDPDLLYRPRPGSCVFENAEFRTVMHFDERGARRTPEPPPPAPGAAGKPRLVIVGDSHAMGWGVDDVETFASVLATDYGFPTVNFAVSSYGTPRELLRLKRDFTLAPDDIVVIQYSNNDLEEGRRFLERASLGRFEREELDRMLAYRPDEVSALSVAGVLLRIAWEDLTSWAGTGTDRQAGSGAPGPAATFLGVLSSHPELAAHRVLVVAISRPGVGTHLSADALREAGYALVVPELTKSDFLDIDDHLRARGHRAVAAALDAALRNP